jgi:hypothetical protein
MVVADGFKAVDDTDELARWLADLAAATDPVEMLLDPTAWRPWAFTVALVRPDGDWLPHRRLVRTGEYLSTFGPLTYDGVLPYTALDLAAAVIAGRRAPVIEQVWTLRPTGQAESLRAVSLPGGAPFDPTEPDADLYAAILASRVAVGSDPSASATTRRRREAALKGLGVALAYGCLARVDRRPIAEAMEVERIDPWGERFTTTVRGAVEEPGPDHCPLLASAVTAAARLTMALVERMVTDAGGVVAQVLTDAVTIPASPEGGWAYTPDGGVPLLDFPNVEGICQRLTPLGITLRAQHGTLDEPTEAYIAGTNRYVFVQNGVIVHTSEFALGGIYLDPSGRGDCRAPASGARLWIDEGLWGIRGT